MRGLALLALLTMALLAGCSSNPPKTASNDPAAQADYEQLDLQATSSTGVIRGVVVDEAIRPVPGAHLVLQTDSGARMTNSSADGAFGFDGLPQGTYFVKATKPGYVGAQVSADVVPGVESPAAVKVLLTRDPATTPYFSAVVWSGYIECSMRAGTGPANQGSVGVNACDGVGNQDVDFTLAPFDKTPDLLQGELVWQNTQTFGSGLSFVVGPPNCDDIKWARADGASPLVIRLNQTDMDAQDDFKASTGLCYRVFSYTASESADTLGLVSSQKFDAYFHAFYNFRPQDGWQFSKDGDPLVPV